MNEGELGDKYKAMAVRWTCLNRIGTDSEKKTEEDLTSYRL